MTLAIDHEEMEQMDREVATLFCTDASSGEEFIAIVRVLKGHIGVTLSLLADGDVAVFFTREDCGAFARAIAEALSMADGSAMSAEQEDSKLA
jgi:hypothetical protein